MKCLLGRGRNAKRDSGDADRMFQGWAGRSSRVPQARGRQTPCTCAASAARPLRAPQLLSLTTIAGSGCGPYPHRFTDYPYLHLALGLLRSHCRLPLSSLFLLRAPGDRKPWVAAAASAVIIPLKCTPARAPTRHVWFASQYSRSLKAAKNACSVHKSPLLFRPGLSIIQDFSAA